MIPFFATLLTMLILFYPSEIAPDPLEPIPPVAEPVKPVAAKPTKPPQLESMGLKKLAVFDRERFLKSFERQTSPALIKCLQVSVGEKGALELIARLHSNGKLSAVRSTNATPAQLSCALPMLESMRFPNDLSPELERKSGGVEIEWRLDW